MGLWLIRFSSSRHRDRWSWTWIFAVCWLGSVHRFILCWLSEPDSWWLQSKQRSSTSSSSGLRHDLSGMSWSLFSIGYAWNASPGTIPGDIGVRWSNLLHWLCLMWMRRGYQMTAVAAPKKKSQFPQLACFLSLSTVQERKLLLGNRDVHTDNHSPVIHSEMFTCRDINMQNHKETRVCWRKISWLNISAPNLIISVRVGLCSRDMHFSRTLTHKHWHSGMLSHSPT